MDRTGNGAGYARPSDLRSDPPPAEVQDLAEGCVRFVERATGVRLDYTPETLPVLDHYLAQARTATARRAEALPVVAQMAGAYLGEVIRRRHASWWRIDGQDPLDWRIELEAVYLAVSPVLLVREALAQGASSSPSEQPAAHDDDAQVGDVARLELEERDRQVVEARLADLPPVPVDEYYAPSTRLEVIDIAVDAIRARRAAEGEDADAGLEPGDYERGDD